MNSSSHQPMSPALSFSLADQQLRVVMLDNDPWFIASDVCAVLGLVNVSQALNRLEEDEKGITSTYTLGGTQEALTVNESGLYTLVLSSRKPEAKAFRRWVTSEVLPSIRKTGVYALQKQVPRDRQIRICQSLMVQIGRATDPFCREGLVTLAGVAFRDAGLPLPDPKLLTPLQAPLLGQGGTA